MREKAQRRLVAVSDVKKRKKEGKSELHDGDSERSPEE